jgi:hypothetical protein
MYECRPVGLSAFENEFLSTRFKPVRQHYDAATYSTAVFGVKPKRNLQAERKTCMACFCCGSLTVQATFIMQSGQFFRRSNARIC